MGEVQEKKPNGCVEGFKGFCRFLYNPDDNTVFGRTGSSWGKILIFYLIFYGCLAGFFAICLHVMMMTIDPNVPTVTGRTNKPVLAISDSRLYKMNFKDSEKWAEYKKGAINLRETYENQTQNNMTASFEWSTTTLGASCGQTDVEFAVNSDVKKTGCFFLGLNRMYNWTMDGNLVFDCEFDEGPAGSGNLEPEAVSFEVFPAVADQSLSEYYPWKSLADNGLQPIVSVFVQIDPAKAAETVKAKTETYIKCLPYYLDGEERSQVPDSSPAKFEIIYQGKTEEE